MRAALYERFGATDVLRVGDLPTPRLLPGEALVRVHAASVNPKDVLVRKGKFRRISGEDFPRVPGHDFAGIVEAVAPGVASVKPGDAVYGMTSGWSGRASAELLAVPVTELARKPATLSMTEAAAVPLAALTALQALRDLIKPSPGSKLCVHGASGGVGTFAVQLGALLGARVTAVCSARNAALVRSLGAEDVIDYAVDDPAHHRWDDFFDVFGNRPYPTMRRALQASGTHVTTVPSPGAFAREAAHRALPPMLRPRPAARLVVVQSRRPDLEDLADWIDDGELRPIVDRTFPLEQIAEAHAYIETKRARGKVVLTLVD